jgi:hypothetical protein
MAKVATTALGERNGHKGLECRPSELVSGRPSLCFKFLSVFYNYIGG